MPSWIVLDLMASGRLRTDGLLTHTFAVTDYRRALRSLLTRGSAPVVKVAFRHPPP